MPFLGPHPGVMRMRGWCTSGVDAHPGLMRIRGWCASGGDAHPGVMHIRGWCARSRGPNSSTCVLVRYCTSPALHKLFQQILPVNVHLFNSTVLRAHHCTDHYLCTDHCPLFNANTTWPLSEFSVCGLSRHIRLSSISPHQLFFFSARGSHTVKDEIYSNISIFYVTNLYSMGYSRNYKLGWPKWLDDPLNAFSARYQV